jgi:hypothetical protein
VRLQARDRPIVGGYRGRQSVRRACGLERLALCEARLRVREWICRGGLHAASSFRPLAEEVVINAGKLHDAGVAGRIGGDALNADVHFEQQGAAGVVTDHAL